MQKSWNRNELGVFGGQKRGPGPVGEVKGESKDKTVKEMGKEQILGASQVLQPISDFILSVMGDQCGVLSGGST